MARPSSSRPLARGSSATGAMRRHQHEDRQRDDDRSRRREKGRSRQPEADMPASQQDRAQRASRRSSARRRAGSASAARCGRHRPRPEARPAARPQTAPPPADRPAAGWPRPALPPARWCRAPACRQIARGCRRQQRGQVGRQHHGVLGRLRQLSCHGGGRRTHPISDRAPECRGTVPDRRPRAGSEIRASRVQGPTPRPRPFPYRRGVPRALCSRGSP